jgi:NDP-sugar pyrophosphorylase family protein
MKVVLLAGGFGTRLSEETDIKPKPMVEIGGKSTLWHIMKTYSHYGFNDFVVLLRYKGCYIKECFANYFLHQSNVTIDMINGKMEVLNTQVIQACREVTGQPIAYRLQSHRASEVLAWQPAVTDLKEILRTEED